MYKTNIFYHLYRLGLNEYSVSLFSKNFQKIPKLLKLVISLTKFNIFFDIFIKYNILFFLKSNDLFDDGVKMLWFSFEPLLHLTSFCLDLRK